LPAQFDLDPSVIEQAFFEKSKQTHPDRFPPAERVQALMVSRAVNDAYKVLKNPVARAEYLLAQAGVTIGGNEQVEPELLMEILELREELAENRKNVAVVERLQAEMQRRRDVAVGALPGLFVRADLPEIKKQLIVLRYLDRYLEECNAVTDQ
jgi:molecular chaperone HscB